MIEQSFARDTAHLAQLSAEAVTLARRCGDSGALSASLVARHWSLWAPENIGERLQTATELLMLARESGSAGSALQGQRWRLMDLLELGDIEGADAAIDAYEQLAEQRRVPAECWYTHLFRAMRLLMSGRYEDAQGTSGIAFSHGNSLGDPNAQQAHTLQMVGLHRDRGGLETVEADVRANVERYPAIPGWRCVLAHVRCELGDREQASRELAELSRGSCEAIPRDGLWLAALAHLAEVAVGLRDVERAAGLHALLEPFADRNIVVGWASSCMGSAARLVALLAAVIGHDEDAEHHFERAVEMNARMGAEPWLARTRIEYATFLLARRPDQPTASALLAQGLSDAARLGMRGLLERAGAPPTPAR